MISDFAILGISETNDISLIKKAFRTRVKALHPDIINDISEVNNHYLFVDVCNAYERLVKKSENYKSDNIQNKTVIDTNQSITQHKDPAYAYYKTACKYYELVHPSHWNLDHTITINGKTEEEYILQKETRDKVQELVSLFPKAYYYYSIVVHEYAESVWVHDSREKMILIEKRMKTYKKIIDSFISWNSKNK